MPPRERHGLCRVARAYGMGSVAPAYGRGSDSGLWKLDPVGPRCAAWLRWGQSAPHTCHARYVRLGLLPVFQGEVPEVLSPLVGCM